MPEEILNPAILTADELQLSNDAATLLNAAIAQVPSEKAQLIKEAIAIKLAELAGLPKPTLVDVAKSVINVAKDITHEVGDARAQALVDDIAQTAEDAVDQKYFALLGDIIHIGKDIKAYKKG